MATSLQQRDDWRDLITDVKKRLAAVSSMVDEGNRVVFDAEGSYIENKASGDWFPLEEKNGMLCRFVIAAIVC